MGAIAVSKKEEQRIERLRKRLGIPTTSGLIRAALMALGKKTEEEQLRREVQESARRCAAADKEENRELFPEERFEAAVKVAREAFKGTSLAISDIQAAVRNTRTKAYAERQKKNPGRR